VREQVFQHLAADADNQYAMIDVPLCAPINIAPAPKKSPGGPSDRTLARRAQHKIHTLADALGNPVGFFLTGGEAHDHMGADHFLPTMAADKLIVAKAFDGDQCVLERCLGWQNRRDPTAGQPVLSARV
jgi:hypothetical protein